MSKNEIKPAFWSSDGPGTGIISLFMWIATWVAILLIQFLLNK